MNLGGGTHTFSPLPEGGGRRGEVMCGLVHGIKSFLSLALRLSPLTSSACQVPEAEDHQLSAEKAHHRLPAPSSWGSALNQLMPSESLQGTSRQRHWV